MRARLQMMGVSAVTAATVVLAAVPADAASRVSLTAVPVVSSIANASLSSSGRYVFGWDGSGPVRYDQTTGATVALPGVVGATANDGAQAFVTTTAALVPADTNGTEDVYRVDVATGAATWVSNALPNDRFGNPYVPGAAVSASADGNVVAFAVSGPASLVQSFLVRDLRTGKTVDLSVGVNFGSAVFDTIAQADVSADGTMVAFAVVIAPTGCNGFVYRCEEIWIRNTKWGVPRRAVKSAGAGLPTASSWSPSLSADGTKMAFRSAASNLAPGVIGKRGRTWLADLTTGVNELVFNDISGTFNDAPQLSDDGTRVAFAAPGPVYYQGNRYVAQVGYLFDKADGTTIRLDRRANGALPAGPTWGLSLSADGRSALFWVGSAGPGVCNGAYCVAGLS